MQKSVYLQKIKAVRADGIYVYLQPGAIKVNVVEHTALNVQVRSEEA